MRMDGRTDMTKLTVAFRNLRTCLTMHLHYTEKFRTAIFWPFFIVLLGQIYTVNVILGTYTCAQIFQFRLDGQSSCLSSRSPNCVFRLTITHTY